MTAPSPAAFIDDPAPVAASERVATVDVLRGFTLYGVLLANTVGIFNGRSLLPPAEAVALDSRLDVIARGLLVVFVNGKSQTLLTCLFGFGFAIQLARAEARGRAPVGTFLRRIVVMLAIGACHVSLLWWGDVLWGYALVGWALLFFRGCRDRTLLVWAAALVLVPSFLSEVPAIAAWLERVVPAPSSRAGFKAELLRAIQGHDYPHLIAMQAQRGFYYFFAGAAHYVPWMLGRFLLGYLVGRSQFLSDAAAHLPAWRKIFGWGLAVGLVGGGMRAAFFLWVRGGAAPSPAWKMAMIAPDEAGVLGMSFAYAAGIVLLMERPAWRRRLMVLAPAGQMALTTYIMQSVISTFVFYGWGLGLVLRVGTALCVPLTLAIFAAQLVMAKAWLARFRFGPLEWVWRTLTYGRWQPMRARA